MLVGEKGLTCVGGKLFSFFRFVLLEMLGVSFSHSGYFFLSRRVFFSLTEGISISHRAHRFNRTFLPTFRAHKIVAPPPTPPPQGWA
ncbi:hypothetical protein CRM71_12335 [Prevotella jejuni]|uniref:Uncharacterized protein n=1 Tax=Prevotella jejuni TaxID=1177574 RepID=A0A2K9HBV8_9BACT|nr:hypothetical protein CRM71_12335 [Prevotella jejuni]SNR87189.1 hypothetical protein SAMN06265364_11614 [Prevotella jejuni]